MPCQLPSLKQLSQARSEWAVAGPLVSYLCVRSLMPLLACTTMKEKKGRRRSVSAVLCERGRWDLKCRFVSLVSASVLPTALSTLAQKRSELKISCAACKVIVCIEGNRRPQCLRIRLCVSSPPGIWSSHCRALSQESSMQTASWPERAGTVYCTVSSTHWFIPATALLNQDFRLFVCLRPLWNDYYCWCFQWLGKRRIQGWIFSLISIFNLKCYRLAKGQLEGVFCCKMSVDYCHVCKCWKCLVSLHMLCDWCLKSTHCSTANFEKALWDLHTLNPPH